VQAMAEDQLANQEERQKEKGDKEEAESTPDVPPTLPEITIRFVGTIEEIYLNDEQQIVVVDAEGKEQVVEREKDPETGNYVPVQVVDDAGSTYVVDSEGNVTEVEELLADENLINVQKELIIEVLQHFKKEIEFWLENNSKGPLDQAEVMRLMDLPDCLPQDINKMEDVLDSVRFYLNEPDKLLEKIQEDKKDQILMKDLIKKLIGQKPPYAPNLSEFEWNLLIDMVCAYFYERSINYEGFAATIQGDTVKTDEIYIVNASQVDFKLAYWSKTDNVGELSYKVTLTEEGSTTEESYASDDDELTRNKPWTLVLEPVKEGKYTVTHKIGDGDEVKYGF